MNVGFTRVEGKTAVIQHQAVNLGLAIDIAKPDGTRQLLVPGIKGAQVLDFAAFWATYEELVRKARTGALGADDFAGTTATLTNPGTIGTVSSVPRLMAGQGLIVGVGSLDYPAEWQGAAEETLARAAKDIERAKQVAFDELLTQVTSIATEAAARIVRRELTPEGNAALVDQVVEDFAQRRRGEVS